MPTVLLDDKGLAPAICQHEETGAVLMLGYVSPGAVKRTLEGGEVWFYSRSRSRPVAQRRGFRELHEDQVGVGGLRRRRDPVQGNP